MARNRKSQSAVVRFGPALKASLLCLLLGGSGIGYVWQKDQILRLGQQKKILESRLTFLEHQNDKLRKQLARLSSPDYLERTIKELKLGLVQPQASQLVFIIEPSRSNAPSQFASQNGNTTIMP